MNTVFTSLRSGTNENTAPFSTRHTDVRDLYSVRSASRSAVYCINSTIAFFLLVMVIMAFIASTHSSKTVADTLAPL